jgi:putative hydrolase
MITKKCSIPLVEPQKLIERPPHHDFHLHTDFTDGKPTIGDYADRAIEIGLSEIGFPEHCNLRTTWLPHFVPVIELERKRCEGQLRIHWGIEAKVMDVTGSLAASADMINAAEYIYGAFHSSNTDTKFPALETQFAIEMEFQMTAAMIKARSCHVVAHPGGLSDKYHGGFPTELFDELAKLAARNDVALEINPGYGADVAQHIRACINHSCRVAPGSNAHDLDKLGLVVDVLTDLK